ncbi:MAG: hypothetical protein ACW972_03375 [Promethearchaeota archaeon]|jgi:hypothetical protein
MESVEILNALTILKNNLDDNMIKELRSIIKKYNTEKRIVGGTGKISKRKCSIDQHKKINLVLDFN